MISWDSGTNRGSGVPRVVGGVVVTLLGIVLMAVLGVMGVLLVFAGVMIVIFGLRAVFSSAAQSNGAERNAGPPQLSRGFLTGMGWLLIVLGVLIVILSIAADEGLLSLFFGILGVVFAVIGVLILPWRKDRANRVQAERYGGYQAQSAAPGARQNTAPRANPASGSYQNAAPRPNPGTGSYQRPRGNGAPEANPAGHSREKELEQLDVMLGAGLIDRSEYQQKKREILTRK